MKQLEKEQLLVAEYTSIMEHFRTYQSNRLNIVLLAVPVVGAVMLNSIDKKFIVQLFCITMLYFIILFLAIIDKVFMKRLRSYTIRLSKIEAEFDIIGHATKRLTNPNRSKDATSNTIRHIAQALNLIVSMYSMTILYLEFFEQENSNKEYEFYFYLIILIPLLLFLIFFFIIRVIINAESLPLDDIQPAQIPVQKEVPTVKEEKQ